MNCLRLVFEWILFLCYYGGLYFLIFQESNLDVEHDHYDQAVVGMVSLVVLGRFLTLVFNTVKLRKNSDNEERYQAIL